MYHKRVDKNQKEIIAALREAGFEVKPLHAVGSGFPDLLIAGLVPCDKCGELLLQNILLEVKTLTGIKRSDKTSKDQDAFRVTWPGPVYRITSAEDVFALTGRDEQGQIKLLIPSVVGYSNR